MHPARRGPRPVEAAGGCSGSRTARRLGPPVPGRPRCWPAAQIADGFLEPPSADRRVCRPTGRLGHEHEHSAAAAQIGGPCRSPTATNGHGYAVRRPAKPTGGTLLADLPGRGECLILGRQDEERRRRRPRGALPDPDRVAAKRSCTRSSAGCWTSPAGERASCGTASATYSRRRPPNGEDAPGDDVAGPGIGFGDGRSTGVSFVPLPCQVSGIGDGQRSCLTVEFWAAWPGGEAA